MSTAADTPNQARKKAPRRASLMREPSAWRHSSAEPATPVSTYQAPTHTRYTSA